ncbi:MFS transporter [Emcibacter nanhaiensis]|uniref:MFS transporter n=1 Tax=Emcibacter nanhaiensis TaxID=1505037 RepID=A0A501PG68_9PROT|nr:MFS transporter [Emcibacter nanhaiensis]TPD59037.1 MFS transporter [Emcibacter nanhaiensis]
MNASVDQRQPGMATGLSLLVPITLSTMAIVLLAPILPQLQAEFKDVPNADYLVPVILTLPALCVAIFSPIAGIFGDYFGRRRLLLWSLALYGVVGPLPIFLNDIKLILMSRVVVGITEALIMTLTTTLIADYYRGEVRNKWLAAQTATASLSALLFFNIGGLLGTFGWRMPFWVYTSSFVMLIAVLIFTWEPEQRTEEGGKEHAAHSMSWASFPWLKMGGIIMVTIFASVLFYTVQIQAAPGLVAHGLSDSARIGFLTSVASLGVPFGTFVYSRINKLPVGGLLFMEFFILGVGFFMMSRAENSTWFLVGCGLNQIGAGMILPTLLVWAVSQLAFEVRARGAGIWQSAFALGQFLSPIVVTFISLRVGGLLPSFQYLGVGGLVAAVCAMVMLINSKRQATAKEIA